MSTRTCPSCQAQLEEDAEYCEQCEQEFCPDCYAPIGSFAGECTACGAQFTVYCPECDSEIAPDATRCMHCGYIFATHEAEDTAASNRPLTVINSRATMAQATLTHTAEEEEAPFTGECPACGEPLFIEDGFCPACETSFCPSCVQIIDEEDELCPHCGILLYFDCPVCSYELTAGTDMCPNCNALFLSACPQCHTAVKPTDMVCKQCGTDLPIEQRQNARVIHTLASETQIIYIYACTECGTNFDSNSGQCPNCGRQVCPNCQLVLERQEEICPRCRQDSRHQNILAISLSDNPENALADTFNISFDNRLDDPKQQRPCPQCGQLVTMGQDQCENCGQLLCPNCLAAVAEDDMVCANCGAEFELACPNCGAEVDAQSDICPICNFKF